MPLTNDMLQDLAATLRMLDSLWRSSEYAGLIELAMLGISGGAMAWAGWRLAKRGYKVSKATAALGWWATSKAGIWAGERVYRLFVSPPAPVKPLGNLARSLIDAIVASTTRLIHGHDPDHREGLAGSSFKIIFGNAASWRDRVFIGQFKGPDDPAIEAENVISLLEPHEVDAVIGVAKEKFSQVVAQEKIIKRYELSQLLEDVYDRDDAVTSSNAASPQMAEEISPDWEEPEPITPPALTRAGSSWGNQLLQSNGNVGIGPGIHGMRSNKASGGNEPIPKFRQGNSSKPL